MPAPADSVETASAVIMVVEQTSRLSRGPAKVGGFEYTAGDLLPRRKVSLCVQLWNVLTFNHLVMQSYLCIKGVFKNCFKCTRAKCTLAHRFRKD